MTERTRLGALRATALLLAILLWLFVTIERRGERPSEKIVDATVTYNPPPGMIILDPVEKVRVRLRGSERAIRRVNPFQIDVQGIVHAEQEGPVEVHLGAEDVMMPEGLEVVSLEPSVLRLHVDREVRQLLPIEVPLVGEPAAGAQISGKPRVVPPEVLVIGPRKIVGALSRVSTNPINLDGHALDFQESTLLVSPDPLLQLETQVATVTVSLQQPHLPPTPTPTPKRGRG